MKNYRDFVRKIAEIQKEAGRIRPGGFPTPEIPPRSPDAPVGMIFSPHPDDECINGGLPLRLRREAGFRIINVPVTFGSNRERQKERMKDLTDACRFLGFGIEPAAPGGLAGITPSDREKNPKEWDQSVGVIARLLEKLRPRVLFFPHRFDRHPTHCGTHLLVADALRKMPTDFTCLTIENEFWGALEDPNLLVELDEETVAELISALSFHLGEIRRNPYHLTYPSWLIDNVRRGAEIIGSRQGEAAPDFLFGVLHKASEFKNGRSSPLFPRGRFLPASNNSGSIFR